MKLSIKLNLTDLLPSLLSRKQKTQRMSIEPKRDSKPMPRESKPKTERERLKRERGELKRLRKMLKSRPESRDKGLPLRKLKRSLLLSKLETMKSPPLLLRLQDRMLRNKRLLLWLKLELKRLKGLKLQLRQKFRPPLRNSKEPRQLKPPLSKLKRIDWRKSKDLLILLNNKDLKMKLRETELPKRRQRRKPGKLS